MISWLHITGLGDTVVMLPAATAIAVWLAMTRAWRMALIWCLMFGAGLLAVVATKIAFVGWGIGIRALDFTGISGHAMRASAVLPVLCYLGLREAPAALRHAGLLLGIIGGALLTLSRVAVQAHSVSEALSGFLLGSLISLTFISLCHSRPTLRIPSWLLALSLLALIPSSYAKPAPTSRWINGVALYLASHDRPYEREYWLACKARKRTVGRDVKQIVRLIY